jgi:hypothetical protein
VNRRQNPFMTHYYAPLSVDGGALFLVTTELLYYTNWVLTNHLLLGRAGPLQLSKHNIRMFHSRQPTSTLKQLGRKVVRRVNTAGSCLKYVCLASWIACVGARFWVADFSGKKYEMSWLR